MYQTSVLTSQEHSWSALYYIIYVSRTKSQKSATMTKTLSDLPTAAAAATTCFITGSAETIGLQVTPTLLVIVFYYSSSLNFLFPVTISTSGYHLKSFFGYCEVADGHFCCSQLGRLQTCWLQPLQCHCQLTASMWAIPPQVVSLVVRRLHLFTAYFSQFKINGVVILEYNHTVNLKLREICSK